MSAAIAMASPTAATASDEVTSAVGTNADVNVDNNVQFTRVPVEVLLQITSHLKTPEYGNFRRTCKFIESTLFVPFSKEFFSKKQFMVTPFSLQALIDISKSRMSATLRHVIIGLDVITVMPTNARNGNRPIYSQEFIDFKTLLSTSLDVDMLTEAFSNLKHLTTVGIRNFCSTSRHRDYPRLTWRSYGASTYEKDTNCVVAIKPDDSEYSDRVFKNVLLALGRSCSQPAALEILLRYTGLQDESFNLPSFVMPILKDVLANLRTLFLSLHNLHNRSSQMDYITSSSVVCDTLLLRRFISRTPLLEHLRLNFQKTQDSYAPRGNSRDILEWLSKPAVAGTSVDVTATIQSLDPPSPELANLKRLDIGMVTTSPDILLALFTKFRTSLTSFSVHRVTLSHPNQGAGGNKVNLWKQLFIQLSKLDLNLTEITTSLLTQDKGNRRHLRFVKFSDRVPPRASKSWAGTNLQSGLRDYIDAVIIEGADENTEDEVGSDNSEDSAGSGADDDDDDDDDAGHDNAGGPGFIVIDTSEEE